MGCDGLQSVKGSENCPQAGIEPPITICQVSNENSDFWQVYGEIPEVSMAEAERFNAVSDAQMARYRTIFGWKQ